VLINQPNLQQISPMLPATFNHHISDQDCLLMSLIASNKSAVIIYADQEGDPEGIQSFHHKKFKDLCTTAGRCLDHVYQLRAGAKK